MTLHPDPSIGGTTGRSDLFENRPLVSTEEIKVSVPGDYSTIQDALVDVPILLKHRHTIQLDPTAGLYDEDVVIPPVWAHGFETTTTGINTGLFIFGDPNSDGSRSDIGSAHMMNPIGYFGVRIDGVRFNRDSTWSDDPAGLVCYGGTGKPLISDCDFDGPTQGVLAYGQEIIVDNLAIASTVDYGIRAKRGGRVHAKRVSGDTTLYATGGHNAVIELQNTDTTTSKIHAADGGHIIDNDNGKIYFPNSTLQ